MTLLWGSHLLMQTAFADEETNVSQLTLSEVKNTNTSDKHHEEDCSDTCKAEKGETEQVKEKENITICHKSDSDQKTIRVSFSTWVGHKLHDDYLGSCHKEKIEEEFIVIKGCKGEYRKILLTMAHSYFDPIIIRNEAYDDERMVLALSECLDHGDDSHEAKGDGYNRVSDGGKYHRISGCNNKGSGKNYRATLIQEKRTFYVNHKHIDRSLNLPDSSMDDSLVYEEYEKCTGVNDIENTGKGAIGYKYREMNHCPNALEIKTKIADYQEKVVDSYSGNKYVRRPIIVKSTALQDVAIKKAVEDCTHPLKGEGSLFKTKKTKGYLGRLNWKEKSIN